MKNNTSNKLRIHSTWTVEENDHGTFDIVNAYGSQVDINGFRSTYETREAAEKFIVGEIARRDRNNARSRGRHSLMTSLGLKRNLDGSYE